MREKQRQVLFFLLAAALTLGAGMSARAAAAAGDSVVAGDTSQADAQANAYYHFTLGHLYEEEAGPFRNSDLLSKAIDEYKQALSFDPDSTEIVVALAGAYQRSGRIREAVVETRKLVEANPDNLAAHRLLAQIYMQTLGELEANASPQPTLKLAIEQYEQVARLAPDDTDSLLTLARLYRATNSPEPAEATLKKVLALDPQSETALAALASLYTDEGENEKAAALLKQASGENGSTKVQAALGYVYEQSGQLDKAIDAYRAALRADQDNMNLRSHLAEVLLRANRVDEALIEYKALADANPDDPDAQLRLSQIYRHEKKYDLSRRALEAAKKLAPDNLEIGFNESLLEEAQGNFDAAIAVLSGMVARMTRGSGLYSDEEKHSRGVVLEHLGELYRKLEKYGEAIDVFKLMLPLDEQSSEQGYAQMAETYRQAHQLDATVSTLRQAVERFPDNTDLKLQLAAAVADHGGLDEGVKQARALLTGKPGDRQVYLSLVQIYQRHKKWPQAAAALEEAEKLSDTDDDLQIVYFLRGALHERQKQYEQAEEQFRKVLALNPDSAITLNYLGYMFADQNMKLDEALKLLQHATELDPYNGAYLDSLGWVYYRRGDLDSARKYIEQALTFVGSDPTVQDHLGDILYKAGQLHEAEQAWEHAREEWQDTPKVDFDQEAFSRLEEKLEQLKARLARETPKKKSQD